MTLTETAAHIQAIETYLAFHGATLSKRTISAYRRELRAAHAHTMKLSPVTAEEAAMSDDELLAALSA